MKKKTIALLLVGCAMTALVATGCSNKPSADELKQLDDLKAEVSSLQKEITARESEKAALQRSMAEKDVQLAQCMKDKDAVQQKVGGNK